MREAFTFVAVPVEEKLPAFALSPVSSREPRLVQCVARPPAGWGWAHRPAGPRVRGHASESAVEWWGGSVAPAVATRVCAGCRVERGRCAKPGTSNKVSTTPPSQGSPARRRRGKTRAVLRMSVLVGPERKPPEDEASGSNPLGRTPLNRTPHRGLRCGVFYYSAPGPVPVTGRSEAGDTELPASLAGTV
jgi:hypothetical protein